MLSGTVATMFLSQYTLIGLKAMLHVNDLATRQITSYRHSRVSADRINSRGVTEVLVINPWGACIIHGDDMFTVGGASAVVKRPECLHRRCEQTLFNAPGEALALTDAARLFLSSEKENRALQAPGFDEHLQAALNCYSFAIKVDNESKFLMTFTVYEAAFVLCRSFLWNT